MPRADIVNRITEAGPPEGAGAAAALSRAMAGVLIAVLLAGFLLISPLAGPAVSARDSGGGWQILLEILSLGGLLRTVRGIEIKDVALSVAATLALGLMALRFLLRKREVHFARHARAPWFHAQLLLLFWIALAAWSSEWSGDPAAALAQASIYFTGFGLALAIGWTLRRPHFGVVADALIVISAGAAATCAGYYYARAPDARPGFPLGDPGIMAASVAPATLVAFARIAAAVQLGPAAAPWRTRLALAASVPLCWCAYLTYSRAAIVGLGVGLVVLAFLRLRRTGRWVVAGVAALGFAAAGYFFVAVAPQDLSLQRAATIRYRFYTWRYAAELWEQNTATGLGAGCYPRLAPIFSSTDRALDPAAFMGAGITHAYNEIFEIFAEIGLIGGVTWVGGMLAVLAAGALTLRNRRHDVEWWTSAGIVAGFVALLADAMFSPGLRLPGLPIVFWLLVGLIWAGAKAVTATEIDSLSDALDSRRRPRTVKTLLAALACALAALTVAYAGWRNLEGLRAEAAAEFARRDRDLPRLLSNAAVAAERLLDPVGRLRAEDRVVAARLDAARTADAAFFAAAPHLTQSQTEAALAATEAATAAALDLLRRAPGRYQVAAQAARAVEARAELLQILQPAAAPRQWQRAHALWRQQREWLPYDAATLLALQRYPAPIGERVVLARDALRAAELDLRTWRALIAELRRAPGFDETLQELAASTGPLTPESDADTLVASFAPETLRLQAAVAAFDGDFPGARRTALEAAAMYRPIRVRFPLLEARARAEAAEYAFLQAPGSPADAVSEIDAAIAALPRLTVEDSVAVIAPLRWSKVRYLLAWGRIAAASEVLREIGVAKERAATALAHEYVKLAEDFLRATPGARELIAQWLERATQLAPQARDPWGWRALLPAERGDVAGTEQVLAQARESGVAAEDLRIIRAHLQALFPDLKLAEDPEPPTAPELPRSSQTRIGAPRS